MRAKEIVIIGAGPAGLTAGYQLKKKNKNFCIIEESGAIGGIARTVKYKKFRFDIGGHRFFTKSKVVEKVWDEVLSKENWLARKRLSRIYYNNYFFDYPLRISNVIKGLGLKKSTAIVLSYFNSKLFPIKEERSFEDWIVNRFGWRLYKTYFKSYTEKLWGISCDQIQADWAAQRIRGLSFTSAVKDALLRQAGFKNSQVIKTLITAFIYPKLGPGMMWEKMSEKIKKEMDKNVLQKKSKVIKIILNKKGNKVKKVVVKNNKGKEKSISAKAVFSSMPLDELICSLKPFPPEKIIKAAKNLNYRDFIEVALIFKMRNIFPDNWIYVHDPSVNILRVQNFKNWSPFLIPNKYTCLGVEYACSIGDKIWSISDRSLKKLARKELIKIELISRGEQIKGGKVIRVKKAYPIYGPDYKKSTLIIQKYLRKINNLYPVGRNGMFKYNNMDHSMLTAILSVKNFCKEGNYNVWNVNTEDKYHEEKHEY